MKIKYKIRVILTLFFPHIWGLIFETLQYYLKKSILGEMQPVKKRLRISIVGIDI
jgi:hypothetical protein